MNSFDMNDEPDIVYLNLSYHPPPIDWEFRTRFLYKCLREDICEFEKHRTKMIDKMENEQL